MLAYIVPRRIIVAYHKNPIVLTLHPSTPYVFSVPPHYLRIVATLIPDAPVQMVVVELFLGRPKLHRLHRRHLVIPLCEVFTVGSIGVLHLTGIDLTISVILSIGG